MNQKQFDYVGVSDYHKNGIKGKGIKIMYMDIELNQKGTHADKAIEIIQQTAPESEVIYFHNEYAQEGKAVELAIANGIHIISVSSTFNYSGDTVKPLLEATKKAVEAGILLVCSAGNNGANSMGSTAKNNDWLAVGAADFGWSGSVERQDYSSYDDIDDVNFMALTNMETNEGVFGGTSCAQPFAVGMIALWMQLFERDYNKLPSKVDLLHMIKDNAEDMNTKGRDIKTGVGLMRLPPITNYKTDPQNPLVVKMIKPDGKTTYVHKDFVKTYMIEKNFKLVKD